MAAALAPVLDDLLGRWNHRHGSGARHLVSLDPDGADFLCNDTWQRVEFDAPLTDAAGAGAALPAS